MKFDKLRFTVFRDDFHTVYNIGFRGYNLKEGAGTYTQAYAIEFVMKPIDNDALSYFDGQFVENNTLTMKELEAQELIDCLWAAGLRPTAGSGSAGQLAATQTHLKDMRDIAFSMKNQLEAVLQNLIAKGK